ncbi:MAG: NAD(P)H-dependent glycerol-3-phosphate dehydrogenase [Verrucomicrobiota bacterium]|nr:NAD(P)H-dependent glycerol-3-phosphate dehydrogenase [Verrucomicrobiota bacterium]
MQFTVMPAGAWGTAMAIHLNRIGQTVSLVFRETDEAAEAATIRENKHFLPGIPIDQNIQISCEAAPTLLEADVLILVCPSKFLRPQCREIKPMLASASRLKLIVSLVKGLEDGTNLCATDIIKQELPGVPVAALSGPTFASQVARGQPGAAVLASDDDTPFLREVQKAMSGESLRIYTSSDLIGVELTGSLKNVYAIAAGICDGLGLQDNSKAALLTRSLAEMVRVGTNLGGRVETFYGLTGFGDLILTCNGKESRNRTFGELFAQGVSVEELLTKRQMTVEGYRTCACFYKICQDRKLSAPILQEIHAMLYCGKDPQQALRSLMGRELKAEY